MAYRPDPSRPFLVGDSLPDILAEAGIALGRAQLPSPGGTVKLLCPACGGGTTREASLSLHVDDDGAGAVWQCHRGKCPGSAIVPGSGRIAAPRSGVQRQREPAKPPRQYQPEAIARPETLYRWAEERGISAETVDAFGLFVAPAWFPQAQEERPAIVFPYRWRGEVVGHKYRDRDKNHAQDPGTLPTLFNIDAVTSPDVVVWVEGEPDVMAAHEAGYRQIVSLRDGAPAQLRDEDDPKRRDDKRFAALDTHADLLAEVAKFILAGDMDEPGRVLREELARRLGKHRCWIVTWPEGCKDCNDTLRQHGPERVRECIEAAQPYPMAGVQRVVTGTLLAHRAAPPPPVLSTGTGAGDKVFRFPGDGRIIVITGYPNQGKTAFATFSMIHVMREHGRRFAVFSPEMLPWQEYAARCAEVLTGKPFRGGPQMAGMTDSELADAEWWLGDRLIMLVPDSEDAAPTLDWVLERTRAAVLQHGVTDLLIDPWNELSFDRRGESETDHIGRALQRLRAFGLRHGVNVWVLAHPAKPPPLRPGEKVDPPSLLSIAGSAHWANKADLGLTVHEGKVFVTKARFRRWGRRGTSVALDFDHVTGRFSTPLGGYDMEPAA
ncbi:toprim domain-containing protein [Roseomonas eburnea]|uniref:Toprim domain-containing protein n=1 Tax=Neoroseomonas eburnea TaxID=1346889 RepID=A0A9X9XGC2_9PROT|nr:toprim domain-containing protein [Neoroseomonas eburnea]MBR0682758.1 toprim domain-containing protein [Neoroseomonas eburnea]